MRQYRLIYDQPTNGKLNMAIDEAIMTAVAAGESPPTLRFYAWNPPCLSLGYGQRWKQSVDIERLKEQGWEVVRRATGGRAILHTDELTYSITVPDNHFLAKGQVVESYRRISQAFVTALAQLGLNPHADRHAGGAKSTNPVCFEVPSDYEITTPDGRKLIGSAQIRRKGVVLQHGSLPLHGDLGRICDALIYSDEIKREEAKVKVHSRAATLADALNGKAIHWQEAAEAIANSFAETFEFAFFEGELSSAEITNSETLLETVYDNPEWTYRK